MDIIIKKIQVIILKKYITFLKFSYISGYDFVNTIFNFALKSFGKEKLSNSFLLIKGVTIVISQFCFWRAYAIPGILGKECFKFAIIKIFFFTIIYDHFE